jgi:hypothetical protein
MYIKPLKGRIRRNIYDKRIYMSCNFETTLYKNIHYVYLIGLMYLENGKNQYKTFSLDDKNNNLNIKNNSLSIIKDFLNFILFKFNKKFKIIIYFHNLRSFHGFFIIECINKFFKDIKKNIVIKNNLIYKIELSNLIFLDILNIYNKDLDILSLHLLNKKKNNFNIEKIKTLNDIEIYYKEINNYLYTNVYLLYEIVKVIIKHFFIKYNVDIVLNFTISSISMHIYRTNYLKNNFHIEITKKHKYQFIKHSYYGGLCNVHYTNSKNGYYYDVNSLYPYVMMNNKMPLGKGYFISNIKDVNIDNYFGFISCNVFVPKELTIPPLPMRNIKNINILANGYLKGI